MNSVQVRQAGVSDVVTLSRVGMQSFVDAYRGTADDQDIDKHVAEYFGESAIANEMQKSNVRYFIAEYEQACAGLVKLRQGDVPKQLTSNSAVEVQQLYVATGYQRLGVGRHLLDRAVNAASNLGADGLWLSVWTHADWATQFYRNYGFVSKGKLAFTMGSSEFTDYLMWLPSALDRNA